MKRNILTLFLAAALVPLTARQAGAEDKSDFPWHLGVIDRATVYYSAASIELETNAEFTWFDYQIFYGPVRKDELVKFGTKKGVSGLRGGRFAPLRWRVWGGMHWGLIEGANQGGVSARRIPLKYLDLLDPKDTANYYKHHNKLQYRSLDWCLDPIGQVNSEHARAWSLKRYGDERADPNWIVKDVYADVLPTASDTGLVFYVEANRFRVWRGKSRKATDEEKEGAHKDFVVDWSELKKQGFASPFTEPFQTFGDADTWYFMTMSSKLYVCKKPAEGQKRKLELLYADADAPIKALVTDTATNKTYAFTAPDDPKSGKGKRVYFELAPKLDPQPYEVKPLTGIKVDSRFKTVWELSQVLVADGKVKVVTEK